MAKSNIKVGIVMGSDSDLPIMVEAAKICKEFSVEYELTIVSAHRTPERLFEYAKTAQTRGLQIIIAGAGGAAHLPGMLASLTHLPIIGVPILSSNSIGGWDSILSILQMPGGVPVATVALNGAKNAGLLAIKILALNHENLQTKLNKFSEKQIQKVESSIQKTQNKFPNQFD